VPTVCNDPLHQLSYGLPRAHRPKTCNPFVFCTYTLPAKYGKTNNFKSFSFLTYRYSPRKLISFNTYKKRGGYPL